MTEHSSPRPPRCEQEGPVDSYLGRSEKRLPPERLSIRAQRRLGSLIPYLLVLPVTVLMAVFIYWPMAQSVAISTLNWNLVSPSSTFVGLRNYTKLFSDGSFLQAASNTVLYLVILVPVLVVAPLWIAQLLWPTCASRAGPVYRAVLFTPAIMATAVSAVAWLWIFDPLQGILTAVFLSVGAGRVDWLGDPTLAFACVVVVSIWKVLGFNLLLYLAAFQSIPAEILEAATIDGAGPWAQFTRIRVPLITPTIFFVLTSTTIFVSDDVFQIIQVLTQGGPFGQTQNVLSFLYEKAFKFFQVGPGSAVAILAFVAITTVTWLQFRYVERRVFYG